MLASWAAVFDVNSLRDVKAPTWPMGEVTLPPLSLLVASYETLEPSSAKSHRPTAHKTCDGGVRKQITVPPVDRTSIMQSIPMDIPCNYSLVVRFNTSQVKLEKPDVAFLRVSILGEPGKETWMVAFQCGSQQMVCFLASYPYRKCKPRVRG